MRYILSCLMLFLSVSVFGQVSFQFVPEISGRTVNGLFQCRIMNLNNQKSASLTIAITEKRAGLVCTIKTPDFPISAGNNLLPVSAVKGASIRFADNSIGRFMRQSEYFPEGDYEYCFTLNSNSSENDLSEQCYDYFLTPLAPLSLLEPYDKAKSCDKRPLLTWQPSIPSIDGTYFQLVLAEIKANQNAVEAINYNLPIVNQSGIISPILVYPPSARELEESKKYAWQVTAYKNQTILNRSEIWEFTATCDDTLETPVIIDEGYRDIEDLLKGNFYIAKGEIRFAIVNPYSQHKLNYEISGLNSARKLIKGLPKLELKRGNNKIVIPLRRKNAFEDGKFYVMKITLPNGSNRNLRFTYKEE